MGYTPLNHGVQHARGGSAEEIEMTTGYSSSMYSPPSGPPPRSDAKNRDSKALFQTDQPPVKHWPIHSQQVSTVTPLRAFIIVFDAILASTPIMFIALALVAARIDGRQVSQYGLHLAQTLLLSPTIFPVIFAALMGRCFKHIGLYLAQRGVSLGRLEQLVGCQSLFSALERQITLKAWSLLGLLMTLVWLLSPLGGQSALRLLDTEPKFVQSTRTFHYLNPGALKDSFMSGGSNVNFGRATFVSVYLAALLSSSKYQSTPMDLWGNVKLPAYRSIANSSSSEWKTVDHHHNVTYASLIGIPVAKDYQQSGNVTAKYSLRARQWDITCDSNQEMSQNASNFGNLTNTWKLNLTNGRCSNYPCAIDLKSIDMAENFTVAKCQLSFLYVEAKISCDGPDCRADSMKKLDTIGEGYQQGDDAFTRSVMVFNLMNNLPTVDNFNVGSAVARGSTNSEKWMANPDDFIGSRGPGNVDLYKLPLDVLGERFTIIWNTFWQSTYATTALAGNLPRNLSEIAAFNMPDLTFNATQAEVSEQQYIVYKTNWRWFTALLIASIILQIAAYTGLVLKYITLAPDIIGYASSLTLLNPYCPTPTGGTTLHGLERAAILYDLPVRIGDVCPNEPVGAIAFARGDDSRVARLDRRRWYI